MLFNVEIFSVTGKRINCFATENRSVAFYLLIVLGGSVAEWLACWTQAQKGLGSNRNRDAVG